MSKKVLVGYATRYGSTKEVAETIARTMSEAGIVVDVCQVRDIKALTDYNAVILGAPLFMFHWHKDVLRFLSKHQRILLNLQVAIFALGPTHDPYDEQEWRDSWSQLNKELENYSWLKPVEIEMFGGKYDPTKLKFPLKMMAGSVPASDIRDEEAIQAWAKKLTEKLQ
ncbi:MAG: flavodoxin domain-containing protein [Anaerolineaceae bacterium]|nr:flavodoxin domain-containing protein [Anaerolineaceae bacterium]